MADQPKPQEVSEPRTRSRSKTPGLLNLRVSVERDLNGSSDKTKPTKKAPTVTTIQEESSPQKAVSVKKTRTVTSDYSSDNTSPEVVVSIKKLSADALTEKTSTIITTSTTITTSTSAASKETSKSTTPAIKETNKVLEATQTAILRTSTPKATSKSSHKKITLTPEELQRHSAYKEYKDAGEYWNKFPKTDYTYSELSPHRRELAAGMIAMPNMSRPGLSKHAERVSVMIQRNPTQESFIRQRYAISGLAGGSFAHSDPYDSGEEQLDLSQLSAASRSYRNASYQRKTTVVQEHRSIVSRFFLSIVNVFYGSAHSVSRLFNKSEHNMYYTRIEDERGFIGKISSLFNALLTGIFKKLYLLISTVLFLDTWLLQTSASDVTQGRRKRKFLLWLLILLPFLLFGAFLLADEDQTIVLPASKRATIALSSLGAVLPASLNPSDLDAFRANLFQKLDWRESSLSWSALLPSLDLWSFWDRSPRGGGGQQQYENLKSGLQRSLSAEEYDELMRHIDAYIEGLLAEKYRKKEEEAAAQKVKREIEPEVVVHVAGVVQQSLKAYSYELTQGDVDRVAEQVRVTLVKSYPEVFDPTVKGEKREAVGISEANFVEIQRLIKQQISVTNNNFVISDQQLEELLMKILSSAKLMDLIDSRILLKTKDLRGQQESQSALVENLKNEINEIKQHFTEKLAASSLMLEDNINVLKRSQDKLAEQVSGFRIENDEKYIKLLADIDARLAAVQREQFSGLNSIIKKNIVTILGMNVEQDFTDEDLKTWISNLFVAKDYLENRLKEYQAGVNAVIQQEMERSAATLMKEVSDRIQQEVLVSIQSHKADLNTATDTPPSASGLTEDTVRRIVRDALRIYDADKTGLVDYALESAGGQILSTRCTENYQTHSAQISIFGIPLWYPTNTPRTVISPTMQPGQCWAFSGFPGYLVIQLNSAVVVTGFSLEHISKLLAPNNQIDSAPKNFSVWGLATEHDPDPVQLGSYVYQDNSAALQYFPVDEPTRPELAGRAFRIVELRIESNHGNAHYTCLYRFRVHGERV
ncbi:uncharacterized protein LOC6049703 isoform X1 [Culex quinquefasciatus]|uniref:uncharacterized protein LOC6049703 isoform X1 n=1 Tax=Culex quinquefasciatus TaxID=7176 RepID=UPI0018E3F324|nr:uncharacterized protein LOC6049703 isoform X1 [Culex quinquefasciatus]